MAVMRVENFNPVISVSDSLMTVQVGLASGNEWFDSHQRSQDSPAYDSPSEHNGKHSKNNTLLKSNEDFAISN